MHIAEPKVENSGIPQGVFVKRHRIPKEQSNAFYTVDDLFIGAELPIYGRVFRLTDCDSFTRAFYKQNGVDLAEPEQIPVDQFTKRQTSHAHSHHKMMNPLKTFMEASLGKPIHAGIDATQKFLQNDGRVLRFYCQWDDDKMYGEIRSVRRNTQPWRELSACDVIFSVCACGAVKAEGFGLMAIRFADTHFRLSPSFLPPRLVRTSSTTSSPTTRSSARRWRSPTADATSSRRSSSDRSCRRTSTRSAWSVERSDTRRDRRQAGCALLVSCDGMRRAFCSSSPSVAPIPCPPFPGSVSHRPGRRRQGSLLQSGRPSRGRLDPAVRSQPVHLWGGRVHQGLLPEALRPHRGRLPAPQHGRPGGAAGEDRAAAARRLRFGGGLPGVVPLPDAEGPEGRLQEADRTRRRQPPLPRQVQVDRVECPRRHRPVRRRVEGRRRSSVHRDVLPRERHVPGQ